MVDPLVMLSEVSKVYRQGRLEVTALDAIDLQIAEGDFVALAGPSGSGKTTLLNLIGALDLPTTGTISVAGQRLDQIPGGRLAALRLRRFGYVFQAYNLIPVLTAAENAEFVMRLQGVAAATRKKRVREVLAVVGLAGLEDRRPAELSGGQQQRVAVARALAAEPAVVLADEPTANLDSKTATGLVDLMRELNRDREVTFIVSSHDPKVVDRAARVVTLVDGRIFSDRRYDTNSCKASA